MTTKAKTKKTIPAKPAAKASPAKASTKAPDLEIKPVKVAETTSLTGTGVLEYEIGTDEAGEIHYRIIANNAGGFFSKEWVSWQAVYAACNGRTEITSLLFRGLFRGKSVNTAGFLLAALIEEGLVQRNGTKSRLYILTEAAHKLAPANAT